MANKSFSVLTSLIVCTTITGCKTRPSFDRGAVKSINSQRAPDDLSLEFHRPYEDLSNKAPSTGDLYNRLQQAGVYIANVKFESWEMPDGERLFTIREQGKSIPVASLKGDTLFQYSQVTSAQRRNDSLTGVTLDSLHVKGTNTFIKHEWVKDPEDPESDLVIQLNETYGKPLLTSFHSHTLSNEGMLRRAHNQFLDQNNRKKYEFEVLGPATWRLRGSFFNGALCDGSVITSTPGENRYTSATRQFGSLTYYRWISEGEKIRLLGSVDPSEAERSVLRNATNCPGMSSSAPEEIIRRLSFDRDIEVADEKARFIDIQSAAHYPVGTPVLIDDIGYSSIFTLRAGDPGQSIIFENPDQDKRNSEYIVINKTATTRESNGAVGIDAFKYRVGGSVEPIGKTSRLMVEIASQISSLNEDRIQDSQKIAEKMEKDRWQLNLAERKANTIDTLSKVIVTGLSVATFDMVYRGLQGKTAGKKPGGLDNTAQQGTKVLGLKIAAGESLASAAINSPAFKERMLAAAYFTLATSTAMSTEIIVATWDEKSTRDQAQTFLNTVLPTGTAVGLKGIFRSGTAQWVTFGAAGLLQRWRVLKGMEALGYQNGSIAQQMLNLGTGATTEILATYATSKGANAGTVGAIYGTGFLIGEIISGRGTPSLILGTTLEIGTNALVRDPRLRPLAIVLSKQINALGQLGEAQIRSRSTSQMLDVARARIYKHRHLVTSLIWLLKNVPQAVEELSPEEKVFVLANAVDPFAALRHHYSTAD